VSHIGLRKFSDQEKKGRNLVMRPKAGPDTETDRPTVGRNFTSASLYKVLIFYPLFHHVRIEAGLVNKL
jgi:hypothetical protein